LRTHDDDKPPNGLTPTDIDAVHAPVREEPPPEARSPLPAWVIPVGVVVALVAGFLGAWGSTLTG
jgi:hypothetical protein